MPTKLDQELAKALGLKCVRPWSKNVELALTLPLRRSLKARFFDLERMPDRGWCAAFGGGFGLSKCPATAIVKAVIDELKSKRRS